MAVLAVALPAMAAAQTREAQDAAMRLPPIPALEALLRAAPCAFSEAARHLAPLPSNLPWARPAAVLLFDGLPGLAPGDRAALVRPTRELMARAATRARIAEGDVTLHASDLSLLPADAPAPAFLALHIAPAATPPEGCIAPGPR
ncbi:hypothetical protein GXW74_17465 [Roseomonas eburnea]|uniref:Uncharacterized protein n=1 Tax=Neoroseomonas eburnea TaxID=1346889 RepID=A0A9X9XEZ8_9PROT|nr:hypothetical protein [Neoroseomonas eburnea]MBR0682284.1 hypothetical protein [Neoroseomonas eburnea]